MDLAKSNEEQRRRLEAKDNGRKTMDDVDLSPIDHWPSSIAHRPSPSPYHLFTIPFSIGSIGYDYRHWKKMGGIPWNDEPGWCQWIEEHKQVNVLDCRQIALHYTFFVQQEWLDRSTLLEDIRAINLPDTVSLAERLHLHRAMRITRQIPSILRRRLIKVKS